MPLRAVAVYGCEVPPGDEIIPAIPDLGSHVVFPGFRITMAAIDPNEEPDSEELGKFPRPRSTLTIIRTTAEDETDIFEEMKLRKKYPELFPELGDDSESDSSSGSDSDEEVNGGPSDPAKSKKARKEAAVKDLIESLKADDSDEEMEEANGTNGVVTSKKKGKAKATEEDSEDGDSDDTDDSDDVDYQEYVVCTLDPENHCQQALDISVGNNEVVYFRVTGTHTVFITGNYQVTDEVADEQDRRKELFHDSLNEYSSGDDSEDSELDLSPDEDELTLDMDDESDELDDLEDPRITEVDSDDEDPPKLIKAPAEKEKKGKNKRTADELDEGASLDDIISKSLKTDAAEEPKLSKKQLKKLKKNNGEAAAAKQDEKKNGDAKDVTPAKSDKSDKKVQFAKNLEQGPTGSAEKPKSAEKEKTKLGPKKVNGVTIDDKKIGSGPAAKKGDRVGMRYIGKLQDGKVFDSNKSGKPFSFKLGAGEVIKGWDIGVAGMSVGGERRLTIPANLAYGSKPNPSIPANSTLVFDVKLLEIK